MIDKARPIAVLGAGGFIGSNLCARLTSMGYEVMGFDIQWPEHRRDLLKNTVTRWADLSVPEFADDAVRGCGTIFHFAADMGGVGYFHSSKDWSASINNARITNNVLKASSLFSSNKLIYASSACAAAIENQGTEGVAPALNELDLHWGNPDQLYGAEKRHGAYMCSKAPIDARVPIFHTIYGPGQEFEGERMKFPSAVAQKARAARKTGKLEMWGNGEQLRSYLYIDDAIDRIMALCQLYTNPGPVMVGSEVALTCNEVAKLALDVAGAPDAKIEHVKGSATPTGVLGRNADCSKFRERVGATSELPIAEGMKKFIDWLDTVDGS